MACVDFFDLFSCPFLCFCVLKHLRIMKIAVYCRECSPVVDQLVALCARLGGVGCVVNPNQAQLEGCDVAVSVGGDGTFLSAVRKMGRNLLPILGVNSGRLGFLAAVSHDDVEEALVQIIDGEYKLQDRLMISVQGEGIPSTASRALNEFALQKSGTAMIEIQIEIDGQQVGGYWADGVIVSTPTGSTAYSMSVGGAILTPGCQNFIISPIAPHNLNIRPLVVPSNCSVVLRVATRGAGGVIATVDNCEFDVSSGSCFTVVKSCDVLQEVVLDGSSFYNTLRSKLMWGVDLRN